MASIKLTVGMREKITKLLMDYKYKKPLQDMKDRESLIAGRVYDAYFGDVIIKRMTSLPKGWLKEHSSVYVRVNGGYSSYFHFPDDAKRRFPDDVGRNLNLSDNKYKATASFVHKFMDDKRDLDDEIKEAKRDAMVILNSVTTINKAIEVWPEAEEFIRESIGVMQKSNAQLPALLTENINKRLGLPPKD